MTDTPDMPPARRRRVAAPVTDPMASPAETAAQPTATVPTQPATATPAAGGRRRPGEPTVSVFIRTTAAIKAQFDDLAEQDGTTARALFEKLVGAETVRRHGRAL